MRILIKVPSERLHLQQLLFKLTSLYKKIVVVIRVKSFVTSVFVLTLLTSCDPKQKIKTGDGFLDVRGGKIWYQVTGKGNKTPVVMLHGGPGYPSYYLKPLLDLGNERPVIIFDQLGCGRSDRISDTTLMTIDHHVDQLHQLLNALNINEFYLYGHSWGTMLGMDYYLKYPEGIKGLIFSSPCLSAERWMRDADTLISTLPDSIKVILRNDIAGVSQDSTKLNQAIDVYYDNFYSRKQPASADLDSASDQMGLNVYQYMWGSSEFFATGTLKNYDRTKDLKRIDVPTLYLAGEFDEARPATVKYYQSITPNSKMKVIPNSGHLTMQDNLTDDIKTLSDFLLKLDDDID